MQQASQGKTDTVVYTFDLWFPARLVLLTIFNLRFTMDSSDGFSTWERYQIFNRSPAGTEQHQMICSNILPDMSANATFTLLQIERTACTVQFESTTLSRVRLPVILRCSAVALPHSHSGISEA